MDHLLGREIRMSTICSTHHWHRYMNFNYNIWTLEDISRISIGMLFLKNLPFVNYIKIVEATNWVHFGVRSKWLNEALFRFQLLHTVRGMVVLTTTLKRGVWSSRMAMNLLAMPTTRLSRAWLLTDSAVTLQAGIYLRAHIYHLLNE